MPRHRDHDEVWGAAVRRLGEDARRQILAAIAHDLQTPLTRLRLRAEALPTGAQREHIIHDVEYMASLVTEGLDYARSAQLRETLPASLDVVVLTDRTTTIRASVRDVQIELAFAVIPPSTTSSLPVACFESSDARDSGALATSQASPMWPIGTCASRARHIASTSPAE